MANIYSYISKVNSLAWSGQEKARTAQKHAKDIRNSWRGESEEVFQGAYSDIHKSLDKLDDRFRQIGIKLSRLQSSMDEADRDKEEKRRQIYRR